MVTHNFIKGVTLIVCICLVAFLPSFLVLGNTCVFLGSGSGFLIEYTVVLPSQLS